MKKAFDQTVREIKREVNKKVLKVPGIEQKVLDATSNEPWGPHGSSLADIAQASRNYHEYQMIMSVIWKRINDTGKNWRHVYKALTILDYLVAHGSERVIDEIREHAYQISTLSDFQYLDSSGRDQGSNVRKKSQSLVALVNDKERIQEVRQKAISNRDKFRNMSSTGGMYRPSSFSSTGGYGDRYDDDRYEGRYGNRDDDRYGRGGDSYDRDGDRYGRDSDERYSRDGYRDDNYRGRSQSNDDYQYGSRSRSSDRCRDRTFEDDSCYSSRSSGAKADDHYQDEKRLERKFSEQNLGAPPSYEEVVSNARSPVGDERDGEALAESVPKASSLHGSISPKQATQATSVHGTSASPANQEVDGFDEFDPRGSVSAASPPTANSTEMDFLGSLSESFSSNSLALMPVSSGSTTTEADGPINSGSGPSFVALSSASTVINQPIEDPFGESPFKATPSQDNIALPQDAASMTSFQPALNQSPIPFQSAVPKMETLSSFDFGETFPGMTYGSSSVSNVQLPPTTPQFLSPEPLTAHQTTDVLAGILPLSETSAPAAFSAPTGPPAQPSGNVVGGFLPQTGYTPTGQPTQPSSDVFGGFPPQTGFMAPAASQVSLQTPTGPALLPSSNVMGNLMPQGGSTAPIASQLALPAPAGPPANAQPQKDKFEPKSTVWADTLNRGLVNLNISGPKINPLSDIGIDFDSINRMEKRKEKPAASPITSTVNMGKAMGSGSGIGRAGAGALRPPLNHMMGSGMGGMAMGGGGGSGMGMGGGAGVGMGGYGGLNQPMGMGMNVGMGMNMGMGQQGVQMRPPTGLPPGPTMPSGYNPMMGTGGYGPQQQYGGYR